MRKRTGFTLIELMIVLAMVGIVLAVAIPAIYNRFGHADPDAPSMTPESKYSNRDALLNGLYVICLDGWEYYYNSEMHRAVMAPKWDAAGMPSACKVEKVP